MAHRIKSASNEFLVAFSDADKNEGSINGSPFTWDVSLVSKGVYSVIYNNRSYNVELVSSEDDVQAVRVNGNSYMLETIDKFDELLKKLGMDKSGAGKVSELKAPMPGLVIEISVRPGDTVKKGDRILVLEAMKMENVIKSPTDGIVASIEIEKGKTVEKNQVMIRFA